MAHNFARLVPYFGFLCRRERATSTVWILCLVGLAALFTAIYPGLMPTHDELVQIALAMSNPAMVAMMGPVYGLDNLTQASVMAQECLIWFMIAAAVMNILLVNRHTRADEELGRLEMFCALPVGRLTSSLATIKFAFLVNLIVSLATALVLMAFNIEGTTFEGALAYGCAIGAVGLVFAGLTLLLAQLFSTAHSVTGLGFALLGLFYILRALGDVQESMLSECSPFGLGLNTEPFYANDFVPAGLLCLEAVVLSAAALVLCALRDHGAGVVPARKGRAGASRFLRGPLGLAWRMARGSFIGWGAGLFMLGASYGSVCTDINNFVEGNDMMRQILGGTADTILDNYVAMIFVIMSMVASVPVVQTALKIRGEERHGRLDQLLSRAVPRTRLYGAFLLLLLIESVVMEFLLALGLGLASGGALSLGELFLTGFAYLPALWVMAGIATLLVGAAPRLCPLVWVVFGYSFVVLYLGRVANLPDWAGAITPFGPIPELPVEEFTLAPLAVLSLVAVALSALGLWRFAKRDIG